MPLIQRFVTKENGAMILAGNTLNCRQSTAYPPGSDSTNGAYISTNTALIAAAGFPNGTTFNPTQSSSTATVNIPSGSTILYAQLFWVILNVPNVVSNQDNAINFKTPATTTTVSPNLAIKQTINAVVWQAQDVKALIQAGGSGTYEVGNVPGNTVVNNSTFIGNSWGLVIVYQNEGLPLRYFNVNTGLSNVTQAAPSNFNFTNFQTPSVGPLNAYFIASESFGDFGDKAQIFIGVTQSTLSQIGNTSTSTWNGVSPYAQINQMLPGNILIADCNDPSIGLLDTRGTFGTYNKNPFATTAPPFARCNQDILGLSIGDKLTNNQTSLFTRVTYAGIGGGYVTSQSIQVDINSPAFITSTKTTDKNYVAIGDTIKYSFRLENTGSITSDNTVFIDTIPSALSFVYGSVFINGVNQPTDNPQLPGISLGSIGKNVPITITFEVVATTISVLNPALNKANITYDYLAIGTTREVGSFETNIVATTITNVSLNSTKQVSKNYANVGDILTYTIPITNIGNTTATNITFIDTIPNGTSLVGSSFTQNGTPIAGSPNPPGVSLNNIGSGQTLTVVFQVRIDTIPNPNPIINSATSSFSYTVDPSTTPNRVLTGNSSTNPVSTQVNNANLDNIVKGVDKVYAKIGDKLSYTITIPNRGTTTSNNVIFKDTIPSGTNFVANSVILNGVQQSGLVVAPPTGLNIGTITPNSTVTLSFQVTVTTIPSPNPIPNSGNVGYSYTVDPVAGTTVSGSNNTNIVSTTINTAVISSTKTVTPTKTTVGETLFYTVVLTNSGNTTANSVNFIDTIPNDTTFEGGSVSVNGTPQSSFNPTPPSGFVVSDIPPNGRTTITFRVSVNTVPNPNPIPNSSNTKYTYTLNPTTGETVANTSLSNTVATFVSPDSNPLKIVDKGYAKPGDILTYTVQWENRLSVTATDVTFLDTIPNDTTFIANSFTVNGVTIPGASPAPPNGINVGTIPSGLFTTVTFKVLVNTIPNPNPIPNQAFGRYSYISDPTLGTITTETATSNIVTTQINYASIPSATKSVNKSFAKVGDVLTYTISFTNTGNTTATNVKLTDTIPSGTSFNINSVFINNVNQPGAVVVPPAGLSIGNLAVNSTTTVVFTVTVDTVPSPNPIPNVANVGYDYTVDPIVSQTANGGVNTNVVNTTINYANLGIIGKTVDKTFTNTSDTLLYTITIRNIGNVTANSVILKDTVPNDTSFINGSALINGVANATVPTGNILTVNMGNLAPNSVASLTFRVQIDKVPTPNPIPNSANASYSYTIDPAIPNGQSASNNTNIVNTQVNAASLGGITKFVDKTFAICGDIITYTISIPNSGNITATNVILSDTVPNGTVFVQSSILINGLVSGATSPTSIPLGTINPGATTTVSFKVQVVC